MNAVIYARYSSESQREESIEGQVRECKEYAQRNGMTVIAIYEDHALSARTDDRPDFQRMIRDSENRQFDVVIVWKLDRFSRDRYDSAKYKHILKRNGVKVLSAKENISKGPEGIILESMLEGYAEYYSAELSEKIHRGQKENALKCKYNGGMMTYGYTTDENQRYVIDPESAAVVRDVFELYVQGWTMKEIADKLSKMGVRTSQQKSAVGTPIGLTAISNMLQNRKYIGEYRYADTVTPNGMPAIIDEDLFERVQVRMAANKRAPAMRKAEIEFLLTTKLYCGSCQLQMVGTSGTSRNGQVHYYYKCVSGKRKTPCASKHKTLRKSVIEDLVVDAVTEKIWDDLFVEKIVEEALALQAQESRELPSLRRQLAEVGKGIDNIVNAIEAGAFNDSLKKRLDELEERKKMLETSIAVEQMARPLLTKDQMLFWLLRFREFDTKSLNTRRQLIDSFLNKVVVYDDKILIVFNYKDTSKQVSFNDIECSDLAGSAPPSFKRVFALYGNRNNIHTETELLKVDMKLLVSLYVYPLENTAHSLPGRCLSSK